MSVFSDELCGPHAPVSPEEADRLLAIDTPVENEMGDAKEDTVVLEIDERDDFVREAMAETPSRKKKVIDRFLNQEEKTKKMDESQAQQKLESDSSLKTSKHRKMIENARKPAQQKKNKCAKKRTLSSQPIIQPTSQIGTGIMAPPPTTIITPTEIPEQNVFQHPYASLPALLPAPQLAPDAWNLTIRCQNEHFQPPNSDGMPPLEAPDEPIAHHNSTSLLLSDRIKSNAQQVLKGRFVPQDIVPANALKGPSTLPRFQQAVVSPPKKRKKPEPLTGKIKLLLSNVGAEWLDEDAGVVREIVTSNFGKEEIACCEAREERMVLIIFRNEDDAMKMAKKFSEEKKVFEDGSQIKVHEPTEL